MRAALLGIATVTLAGIGLAAPASALPVATGIAVGSGIEQAAVVRRTVRRGPHCKTVVVRKRGPMGVKIKKRRTCF